MDFLNIPIINPKNTESNIAIIKLTESILIKKFLIINNINIFLIIIFFSLFSPAPRKNPSNRRNAIFRIRDKVCFDGFFRSRFERKERKNLFLFLFLFFSLSLK